MPLLESAKSSVVVRAKDQNCREILRLLSRREPDILDDHEQMPRVGWRRREAEVPVERDGLVVLGMNGERAHADHVGDLERAPQRIEEQPRANAAALCLGMDGEAGEHQQRNRMAGHALDDALGSLRVLNLAGDDRVEADDLLAAHGDVGLRRIGLLGLQRVTREEAIKLRLSAGKLLDVVCPMQFFDMKRRRHGSLLASNTEGSRNSRSRRG